MSESCLRPGCTTTVPTIGVCTSCADDDSYRPKRDGVEVILSDGVLHTDGASKRKANPGYRSPSRSN